MGGLFIEDEEEEEEDDDDDAIVPSSVLDSSLGEVAMVPDSSKQSVCSSSLFDQMPSLLAVAI